MFHQLREHCHLGCTHVANRSSRGLMSCRTRLALRQIFNKIEIFAASKLVYYGRNGTFKAGAGYSTGNISDSRRNSQRPRGWIVDVRRWDLSERVCEARDCEYDTLICRKQARRKLHGENGNIG